MNDYKTFLKQKEIVKESEGLEPKEPHKILFPFQRDIVKWAIRRGRAALFEDCGTGKTFQSIEWARQIPGDVLIVAPLNVAHQTIEEGQKIDCEINFCRHGANAKEGITITNYESLEHFDASKFTGVVLDECFAKNTLVEVFENSNTILKKQIHEIKVGDSIRNASGCDRVIEVHRRRVERAVKISVGGNQITSSENHPFFTQRGWVAAIALQRWDMVMETSAAMRLVSGQIYSNSSSGLESSVLRDILFSEMADEAARCCCESARQGSAFKNREESVKMVAYYAGGSGKYKTICVDQTDVNTRNEKSCESDIADDGAQTFRAWRQREGYDETAIVALGGTTEWVGERVCLVTGQTQSRLSNLLQAGLSKARSQNMHRGGWQRSSKASRQEARRHAGFSRVDNIEVLERGHPELEQWRDADGFVYFHDLKAARHPSYSVNGLLVHNSSILKNFDGHTRNLIITQFGQTPYRLACTATPAPNDHMELGNHAEFLGVMTRTEMLSMFFVHDGGETSKWRIKGHAVDDYWKWVCSWAVMLRKPSDLGYENDGFELPPLNMVEHVIEATEPMEGYLLPMPAATLDERRKARKASTDERVEMAAQLAKGNKKQWVFWCNLNDESQKLTKLIPGAAEISGSTEMEERERICHQFLKGKIRCVVTKPSIWGFGLNLQCCHNTALVGISDSYEEFYQLLRRFWRFGQTKAVNAHIIISDMEGAVLKNIKRKEADATRMADEMVKHMKDINKANIKGVQRTVDEYSEDVAHGKNFEIHLGDCVEVVKRELQNDSVGFSIFSPPFASLYTYSASTRDMGNSKTYDEFGIHMGFLADELFRVTEPGRLVSFHCMNLPMSKTHNGHIGLRDFRGHLIRCFEERGFIFHSEVCIWKDPVTAMQRTKSIGLLHKQMVKDSCMSRQGVPDYLVTMRKPGENKHPVHGELDKWVGDNSFKSNGRMSIDLWQRYASPVWMDINPSNTLQKDSARDEKDERHICPLQLDVIERALMLWSNPGDLVLSPFAGIGSEGYVAVKEGRKFIGVELKQSYWKQAVANLKAAESEAERDLFAVKEPKEMAIV